MITKFRKRQLTPRLAGRPRTYFVHIPKTAGITLKTFLENNYRTEEIASHHGDARALPPADLNDFSLFTGHFASEALEMLHPRPEVTIVLIREPMARMRSWIAHGRRSQHVEYRGYIEGRTDVEALTGEAAYDGFQSHWLARGLRDGAASKRIPDASELPGLLDQIDIVGLTDEMDRLLQLVSYRMHWAPPSAGWRINRRPDGIETLADIETAQDRQARELLAVDFDLYEQASARFWQAYADMLSSIDPGGVVHRARTAADVPLETVQNWLRQHHHANVSAAHDTPVAKIDVNGDQPNMGEGWWWRECPSGTSYRWSGPGEYSTLSLAPLTPGQDYSLTIECMGAADWPTWEGLSIEVNGHPVHIVRERFGPSSANGVRLRAHVQVNAETVASQSGRTEIVLRVPESRPVPGQAVVRESMDTEHRDERRVGIAVHQLRIEPAVGEVRPSITLRRAS